MTQKNTKKILLTVFVLTFTFFLFRGVFAQEFTQEDYNKILEEFYNKASTLVQQKATNFEISLDPKYPEANAEISARVSSYSFNSDRAHITWSINGKIVEQGRGKKSITFKTGGAGTILRLSVSVTTENDISLREDKEIRIGGLDLIWQADTHTPSLYKGKALPTKGSRITVVAFSQGLGSPENLIYSWRRDFKNLPQASGLGKNSLSFSFTDISSEENIKVKVSTTDGNDLMEKNISIRLKEPEIILYEESPTDGVLFQNALKSSLPSLQPEIVIRAEPYFFLKSDIDSLSYSWSINNEDIEPLSKPNIIGLAIPQGTAEGSAEIKLKVENGNKYLEQIVKSLHMSF